MEVMQEAVKDRCDQQRSAGQKNDTAEQCVRGFKKFPADGLDRIHRPHTCENHRGVHQRIAPAETRTEMISQDPEAQRSDDDEGGQKGEV